jgi:hypothetical protein
MAAPPDGSALAEQTTFAGSARRHRGPRHTRLAIVVFLALMGLMAARYAGLEHDPRRSAAARDSISRTFTAASNVGPLVVPRDLEEPAAAALRRTGTSSHDPAQLEAGRASGEVRLVLAEASLFVPATGRLRDDVAPRIGRLVARVLDSESSRLEIVLNEDDLTHPSAAQKIERLVALTHVMGLSRARVAFGSGPVAPSSWLLEASRSDQP